MFELYTWMTDNGYKARQMAEESGLEYELKPVNIREKDQFKPEFLAFSPNNRIPAIIDHDGPDGESTGIFESGAILVYLAEKTGKFMLTDPVARYECLQWLMFQMGGVGPMFGQHPQHGGGRWVVWSQCGAIRIDKGRIDRRRIRVAAIEIHIDCHQVDIGADAQTRHHCRTTC